MPVKVGQVLAIDSVDGNGKPAGYSLLDPANMGVINPLAKIAAVNFRATGATAMFTVPSGFMAVITGVVFRPTVVSGMTVAAVVSIGTDANGTNIATGLTLTGLTPGRVYVNSITGVYPTPVAGDVVRLNVSTAALATVYSGDVYLIGFIAPATNP